MIEPSSRPTPEDPAAALQRLPGCGHWAVADSRLLLAIFHGSAVERGTWGRRLNRLLYWTRPVGLESSVLLAVGLFQVLRLCLRQGRNRSAQPAIERLFVGFGAGAEEALFAQYAAKSSWPVMRIDQTDVATLGAICGVGWLRAIRTLIGAHQDARRAIRALPRELAPWRRDFLTFACIRLGQYSFMRAWFAGLRMRSLAVREACFLSADTPAFAAVDAQVPTRYLQHGLIRHSLLLPRFDRIDALTKDEYEHFLKRLPAASTSLTAKSPVQYAGPLRGVLIASVYEKPDELKRIFPLLDFLTRREVPICLRLHPREDAGFWSAHASRWNATRDDSDVSFIAAITRLRPRLVASWYSTALAEALQCGIIPISVTALDNPNIEDLVYPLFQRALQWPQDQELLARVLDNDDVYSSVLASLRPAVTDAA